MALYLISYDIAEGHKMDYQPLWDKMDELGAVRVLYSEYMVTDAPGRASAIYNSIAPLTHQDDRLLVQEVARDAHWDKLLISDADFQRLLQSARG